MLDHNLFPATLPNCGRRAKSKKLWTYKEGPKFKDKTAILKLLQEAQLLLGDRATRKHAKDSWNGRGNDNLGW